jgi:hypothetical protein
VEDTYAKASYPALYFGTAAMWKVDYAPDPREVVYLKFDLSPLAGAELTSAKLRLYITNGSETSVSVRGVEDTSWSETGLTYSHRPPMGRPIVEIESAAERTDQSGFDQQANAAGRSSRSADTFHTDGIAFSRENPGRRALVVRFHSE